MPTYSLFLSGPFGAVRHSEYVVANVGTASITFEGDPTPALSDDPSTPAVGDPTAFTIVSAPDLGHPR